MPPSAPALTPAEYYAQHYPYEQLVKLLTRNGDDLANCEFAIEGKTSTGDKLYKRYVSVRGPSELRDAVSRFTGVTAFHFGAFYSNGSSKEAVKLKGESVPVRRVLSFDIDLTDLEFLTLKDAEGNVSAEKCDAAYPVSAAAAYILRRVLQRAFGYTDILIVYSGRRGVHVHVFDEKAMALTDEGRAAVLDYVDCGMRVADTHAPTGTRLIMDLHGLRKEVYRCFHTHVVGELGLLENGEARVAFVNRLNLTAYEEYEKFAPTLAPLAIDVLAFATGAEVWKHVEERINSTKVPWMRERLDCVVLAYVWPRLDAAVTRSLGHLTKVPFSCHAGTGRVAAAMGTERKRIFGFVPARQAPSLKQWQQPVMDAAVAHFRVGDAPADAQAGKRKRSELATCAEDQESKRMVRPHHAAVVGGAQNVATTA
jgi:DNA primase small subunit